MFANISWPQLLILLVLVVLIFGTGKLKGLGKDIGSAIKGFKKAMTDEETKSEDSADNKPADQLEESAEAPTSSQEKSKTEEKSGS